VGLDLFPAQLLSRGLALLRIPCSDQHGDALLPELPGGFKSDALVGTGNQCDFFVHKFVRLG
jgi:hypothetical protein